MDLSLMSLDENETLELNDEEREKWLDGIDDIINRAIAMKKSINEESDLTDSEMLRSTHIDLSAISRMCRDHQKVIERKLRAVKQQ